VVFSTQLFHFDVDRLLVSAEQVNSRFGFGHGQFVRIDDLDHAQKMTAVVDTVIFEDGRVISTDESHLVDYINARAEALKNLVQGVREAMSEGQDVDDLLSNIASGQSSGSLLNHRASLWAMREARSLLMVPAQQRIGRLAWLDQPPPAFYR
jgi:hypothetical protein